MKYLFTCILLAIQLIGFSQVIDYSAHIETIRAERNAEMKDSAESPLKENEIKKFEALNFYAIDQQYKVLVKFTRLKKQKKFKMKTSGTKTPEYIVYGYITFDLLGKSHKLFIYQNVELSKKKEFENYLFLPFTDNTNGSETYGGGRYIDLTIPKTNTFWIDFNLCYNPYCAYTTGYNCPVPPPENYLNIEVKAGEKLLWEIH